MEDKHMNKESTVGIDEEKKEVKLWRGEETRDPKEFVDDFMKDEFFLEGYNKDKMKPGPSLIGLNDYIDRVKSRAKEEIDDEEIKEVFLNTKQTKMLLTYFAKYKKMLIYDESKYPDKINRLYKNYKKTVQLMDKFGGSTEWARLDSYGRQERIKELDSKRQFNHMKLSEQLAEDVFPSQRIGRTVARLWLISEGMDTFDHYERDEAMRSQRMSG